MIIEARAPTRIDLAGGTLDVHPIYLVEGDVWTINIAVEIPVEVRLTRAPHGYTIISRDLGHRVHVDSLEELSSGGPLDLVFRVLRFASPPPGLRVVLASSAPPGSGLGASSALLVALLAALRRLARKSSSSTELVGTAWRIETQSLRTLAGRQDHLAAVHGGVNAIHFGLEDDYVEPLLPISAYRRALQERLVLAYTGRPHASGLTNWAVVRNYLNGVPATVNRIRSIAQIARQMREAIRARDLGAVGDLLSEEWVHRRELASGVATPAIEKVLAIARKHGAIGGKACGAGGGGCVVVFVRAGTKRAVEEQLGAAGFSVLRTRIARRGLQVRSA